MIHVADVAAALDWYSRAFPAARRTNIHWPKKNFEYLELNGIQIEIVPADEKVASGPAGTVVYWTVADFEAEVNHFQSVGATLFRGPAEIEDGMRMCQIRDPWGNCIGLRG